MATKKSFSVKSGLDANANAINNLGVSNASLTLSGANAVTLTTTGATNVTLPVSGTLLYSGGALGTPSGGTLTNCTFPTLNQNTTGYAAGLSGGNNTTLLGSLPYQSNTNTTSLLSPNTTTTKKFLRMTGDGTNGAAPAWDTLVASDIPTLNQNTTGSAATLTTPRAINNVNFDGSAAITITATATNILTISSPLSGTSYNGSAAVSIGLASGYGDTQNPYASKTANYILAAPNGSAGAPTFRAIVAADIPTLNQNTSGSSGSCTGNAATATTASSCSGNSATATKLSLPDLRSTSLTPTYFGPGINGAFMSNATDSLSDGGSYHGVIQLQQWSDASGGGAHQLGFTDNNNIWHRGSSGGITSWASWYKLIDTNNYSSSITSLTAITNISTGAAATAGTIIGDWSLGSGSKLRATYADLAENYVSDQQYDYGIVLMIGGDEEVTIADENTQRLAGVVSKNPAYLMNSECEGEYVVAIALQGRTPVRVKGKVNKGDFLVSAGDGYAKATDNPRIGSIIGKSLESFDGEYGMIEAMVGRL